MATKSDDRLRRHEKVVAASDLAGVPAGTKGKVQLVNGMAWVRYWVRFENGATLGQLHGHQLARASEWDFRRNEPKELAASAG